MHYHYHAIAGLPGYMPNYNSLHDCYNSAVDDLAYLHKLGKKRTKELRKYGYLDLNRRRDGNDYCQVIECNEDCEQEMEKEGY